VRIEIEDHGVGIPKENLLKIFDPFFTTKEKGTGLGLSTVQSIVKNHGGRIEVDSTLGVGTTFSIFLPATYPSEISSAQVVPEEKLIEMARILVMDDEETILDVLGLILSELGHEVHTAKNGEEAIGLVQAAAAQGSRFDLLIMDLTIKGGMGGIDAIKRIREIDPEAIAIVSSGYSNDPVMSDPRKYGFIDVLQKPYTMHDLKEKLATILK
jgi:CheY-like chemotaxis protein